jgi:hypothetical protein
MARTLERPNLYEEDYLAWIEEQIAHLRAGRWHAVDVPHMLEELEYMAGSQRRELHNRLVVLLAHMLKRDRQPGRTSRSWEATIVEQRRQLRKLLLPVAELGLTGREHRGPAVGRKEAVEEQRQLVAGKLEDGVRHELVLRRTSP